jgi:hypothetical protein
MEIKPEIQMYTLGEIATDIARTGAFNFGDYDYVATLVNPEPYERSYHFNLGDAELVVAGLMYDPEPESFDFFSVYMDQCIVFTEETRKFLKLNLPEAAYANLIIVKIGAVE